MQQNLWRLNAIFYGNTFFAKLPSLLNNTCGEFFTDGQGFTYVHLMESKSEAGIILDKLCQNVGIPNVMVTHGSGEQTGKNTGFFRQCNKLKILLKRT